MQKVLRRSAQAQRYAKKRAEQVKDKEMIRDRYVARQANVRVQRERLDAAKAERVQRRENWELGELSPVNDKNKWGQHYGTWSWSQIQLPDVPEKLRIKNWFVRTGDRVCIVDGPAQVKGKIGKISGCNHESETVTIDGINMVEVRTPAAFSANGDPPVQAMEGPIPLRDVRLVYPLPDPETGTPRDVIIKNLKRRESVYDPYKNKLVWSRVVMPQRIRIPWPEEEEETWEDADADTLRIKVEEQTFLPTLLRPPMPMGVIDELRNKYSKFRTRHDDDWVAMKMAEDEAEEALKAHSRSLMPRGVRNIARGGKERYSLQSGSEPKEPKQLSDEVAEHIGAHIAAKLTPVDEVPDVRSTAV